MARKRQRPTRTAYKTAVSINTSTQAGIAELWLERIKRFQTKVDLKGRKIQRDDALVYLDGSYAIKSGGDEVYLNEALPALEDLVYSTIPYLPPTKVESRQVEQENLADMAAALIDATLNSGLCRAHRSILLGEWDEITWGIGVVKMAWHTEANSQLYRPTRNEEYLIPHIANAESENANPEMAAVAENDDDLVHLQVHSQINHPALAEHMAQHQGRINQRKLEYPIMLRVDIPRFAYDPDAEEWEDRDWEAELCEELVSDLEKIPGIRNLNPQNCPAIDEFDNDGDIAHDKASAFDYEKTRVRIWKIHDRVNGEYLIIPDKETRSTKPLLQTDWPYGSLEIYNRIVHRPWPGQIHGLPTIQIILPILRELAKTNASIRRHNRRAARAKMIVPRGAADEQFQIGLESENMPLAQGPAAAVAMMKEFRPPPCPKELLDHREMLLSELRRMLGSEIMRQGGETTHAITASEAQLRDSYSSNRLRRRRQEISNLLSWAARNIVLLYRDWAENEIPVRTIGPLGIEVKNLDPSAIPEDLIVSLDVESATDVRQEQKLQFMREFVGMATQMVPGQFDAVKLLRDFAELGGIRADKYFTPPQEYNPTGQVPTNRMNQAPMPSVPKLAEPQAQR